MKDRLENFNFTAARLIKLSGLLLFLSGSTAHHLRAETRPVSVFSQFCGDIAQRQQLPLAYENDQYESVANIQLFETYKTYEACRQLDPAVIVDENQRGNLEQLSKAYQNLRRPGPKAENLLELEQKILRIFENTQLDLLTYLDEWQMKRVQPIARGTFSTLRLRIKSLRLQRSKICNMDNAAYDPVTHTLSFCREILNYPTATLVAIMAHEMAHAIDPCMLQFAFSKIQSRNPFFNLSRVFRSEELEDAYTTIPWEWAAEDFDVKKEDFITLGGPIPFQHQSFKEQIQCLQSADSIKASRRQGPLDPSTFEDWDGVCSGAGAGSVSGPNAGSGGDSGNSGDGEIQEAFADWLGYELFARYLQSLPQDQQKLAILEGVLNITANECASLKTPLEVEMRKVILNSALCAPKAASFFAQVDRLRQQQFFGDHPGGQRRIERLYLAHPLIRSLIKKHWPLLGSQSVNLGSVSYCSP